MSAWKRFYLLFSIYLTLITTVAAQAIPASFDPSVIIDDSDFTGMPDYFAGRSRESSIALIQKFLEVSGSALAHQGSNEVDYSQIYLDVPTDWGVPDGSWLQARPWLQPYTGMKVKAAEAIWMLSQENLGKAKYYSEILPANTSPSYLLALIQKESGLAYGSYANAPYGAQSVGYRWNRMTGYACFEGAGDCDIEFRSPFRQLYFALRDKKAYSAGCVVGFDVWNQGRLINFLGDRTINYKVGNTITIDNTPIRLNTAIACASYFYTPHNSYYGFYNIMKDVDKRMREISPTVPMGQVAQQPQSSSSVASSAAPTPAPVSATTLPDTFTGVQKNQDSVVREAIRELDAPKPPPPPPPYIPLYTEPESVTQFPDPTIDYLNTQESTPRSITPPSSVAGVQAVRRPWYVSPFFVLPATFVTITSVLVALYSFIRFNK